eukprot:SAG11_NODE_1916_length_4071_cov_3.418429_1_plen_64_part_00
MYKARVEEGVAGTAISSTIPCWAVMQDSASNDEQLLFGNIGRAQVNIDTQVYRVFVARADLDD